MITQKNISLKKISEAIFIKTSWSENLGPVKKLEDHLQELLKEKKSSQDIAIDNTLAKFKMKSSTLWDHYQNCGL